MLCDAVLKDTKERGRELDQVLKHYITIVKPAFEEFTLPVGTRLEINVTLVNYRLF